MFYSVKLKDWLILNYNPFPHSPFLLLKYYGQSFGVKVGEGCWVPVLPITSYIFVADIVIIPARGVDRAVYHGDVINPGIKRGGIGLYQVFPKTDFIFAAILKCPRNVGAPVFHGDGYSLGVVRRVAKVFKVSVLPITGDWVAAAIYLPAVVFPLH